MPISVLLVDDNRTFLGILKRFLEGYPDVHVAGVAAGGEEGIALAFQLRPQVILLDLAMPGVSGLEAIPRLRARLPKVAIIVLSLLEGNGYEGAALKAGADGFVPKSRLYNDLLPAIRSAAQAVTSKQ